MKFESENASVKIEKALCLSRSLWVITRGDTMIFNKKFFDRKFFKTGPRCAEGSIWWGKNKTSPLKKSWIDGKAEKCQKFWLRNRFQNQLDSINQYLLHVKFFNS